MSEKPMQKNQYYHFRLHDENGNVVSKGGVTVCILVSPEGYKTGVALCSPEDNFCKKIGRGIAFSDALKQTEIKGNLTFSQGLSLAEEKGRFAINDAYNKKISIIQKKRELENKKADNFIIFYNDMFDCLS